MRKLNKLKLALYHKDMQVKYGITDKELDAYDALVDEKCKEVKNYCIGLECVIRTYSAGVHVGKLESRKGNKVVVSGVRRLRNFINLCDGDSLTHIALNGLSDESAITAPTKSMMLEFIEIIPLSARAKMTIDNQPYEVVS